MEDTLRLIKQIAGTKYTVSEDEKPDVVNLIHNKCGQHFQRTTSQISLYGIKCPRCNASAAISEQIVASKEELHALNLYQTCKQYIPHGFIIMGDTSSEDNVIEISSSDGNLHYSLKIQDILNNVNLPDCLARRDSSVSSVQLDILDILLPKEFSVLDNFNSLDDTVRVKNTRTLEVKEYLVRTILEGVMQHE